MADEGTNQVFVLSKKLVLTLMAVKKERRRTVHIYVKFWAYVQREKEKTCIITDHK